MNRDLDTRARQAADNLKEVVARADLTATPPGTRRPGRLLIAMLRPAWVAVLLLVGSAVGLALVLDTPPPVSTTLPVPPPTTIITTTEAPTTTEATTPPTTNAVVPLAPATTLPADTEAPPLTITSPREGEELAEKTVAFTGTTEPGARVFAGRYEAEVDAEGQWRIVLVLNEGSNVARFIARDAAGNESAAAVTVYFVVPTTTTTKPETTSTEKAQEEEKKAEFTAHATFGSCAETPPYDVYYGTGEPGSLVQVVSEYGSGSVEVGENGEWELKVTFAEAPPGEYFLVKANDQFGRKAEFEFIYEP